ncbi:alpha/beta hydrolase [Pseudomonas sp. CCI3.2]|uniref:alpha/beta fold hydrolase n=1 Tax=unclassified Pseudomonas TaxID=196821 RepID=UPI002AC8D3FC|nr:MULTISPECIES: alpha/beta hydrolase [unclassified Pseudomonas]MEB0078430.1 alpha/beta hydrolase [Pseudomonas sp. MH10out]MEB0090164.1 alpha/beta hydrolase [Pseudomonas sp. CCI4.2]MEB0102902.1 alpha/beta hydrolase [Pseudomonas sp. CCI3.2]MEB0131787.1 alpha/beta hydrolase [Pseudomonas sp. CCI2.4]MEB0158053.1 alpha/beta hydrolase [Pseudomonas sp. AH2 (2023)]
MTTPNIQFIRTPTLEVAYETHGDRGAAVVMLLHGFPYDPRGYDELTPLLVDKGFRVIVPYLRGYGPTRFLSLETLRSGQQAALGKDLLELMDALGIAKATLVGYDWGGRAACVVAALWPSRVNALVTGDGYNIQDIPGSSQPQDPKSEHRYWYQYYFHSPRGRAGLEANRKAFCRLLWQLWSPPWVFSEAAFERTAQSFDNPDFVDVVIHSYRHRYGYTEGDPALEPIETQLATQPMIGVPTISLCGRDDGVGPPPEIDGDANQFSDFYERRILSGVGHNIPQEAPSDVLKAILDLAERIQFKQKTAPNPAPL